jgi:hypothetical protein
MRYIVIPKEGEPFTTRWFDSENNFIEGSTVIDLSTGHYMNDGKTWKLLNFDHL